MNNMKTVLLLGLMSGIILGAGELIGGHNGLIIALGIAVLMNFFSYWFSDKIVLSMNRAHEIPEDKDPQLHAMVAQLAAGAGVPKPRLFYMDDPSPNAFATGRNPEHSVICVTGGLLDLMNEYELRGVLAHEMSHIKNRDILIGTVAATLAAAITTLARMASFGMMLGGGRDREDSRGSAVGALVMMIFAPLIAMIIQMWISRTREFQADESGAHIAGTPNGLANALLKLERGTKQIPMDVNPATAHMFIVSPLSGGGIARLFSTHPPIEERVERLRKMV